MLNDSSNSREYILGYAMDWIAPTHLSNSRVEAPTPNVTAFGDGTRRRQLGLDEVMRVGPSW